MKFNQIDSWGRVIDTFTLDRLIGNIKNDASQLDIGESIQFTGRTVLLRVK